MAGSQADETEERAVEEIEEHKQGMAAPGTGALGSMLGAVTGKTAELKESAMEFLSEKKEVIKMKIPVTGDCPREVLEGMEEEGRKKMGDIWVAESGATDENPEVEAAVRDLAAKEAAAHRGVAAKSNIMGRIGMGSVKEAIRSKLTMPSQIASETLAAQRRGGTGRSTNAEEVDASSGNTPVGVVDSIRLKANHPITKQ